MTNIKLTIVRIGSALLGLIGLATGALGVYQGASGKLGAAAAALGDPAVLAALDNDFRFLAGIWFIVGLGLLVGAIFIHRKPDLVQIGLEAVFVGGLARAFAFTEYGPLPEFYAPVAVEIIVPVILFVMLRTHLKAVDRQNMAAVPANPQPA